MTLNEVLQAGGEFHYAPISGGLILMLKGKRIQDVPYSMQEFLDLRTKNAIVLHDSMSQGHEYFHGKVSFYKLA